MTGAIRKFKLGGFWETGSLKNPGDATDGISEAKGYNLTGRVTYLPWYEDEGRRIVHLGLSYSRLFRDEHDEDSVLRFRTRPESRITDTRLVDTGDFQADSGDLIGLEIASILGPLFFRGEYLHDKVQTPEDLHFWGYYLSIGYFLINERRKYDTSKGIFSKVYPTRSFHPLKGDWGAWEVALRYSYLDLNTENVLEVKREILPWG